MRNYEKIHDILANEYDITTLDTDFERSNEFNSKMNDDEYVKAYIKYYMGENIDEDATATLGNTGGMGAVVTAQPGMIPGTTGTTGSGDIGAGSIPASLALNKSANIHKRTSYLPRSRRSTKAQAAVKSIKKAKGETIQQVKTSDYTHKVTHVKKFSDFGKTSK